MSKFVDLLKQAGNVISKKSPEILMGVGIAGMFTTTVLAVSATPKALQRIDAKKNELQVDELGLGDTIKSTWICYIPAGISFTLSTACLIGSSTVSSRRSAALATAYELSRTALIDYRDKVKEVIGEKKDQEVIERIHKDKIDAKPVSTSEVIITGNGETLCYEAVSGRYFKSDIEKIKRTINELNRRLLSEMYISLNEFYDEIGLAHTSIGDDIGWNVDTMIEPDFSTQLADDGRPALVLDFLVRPRYNYSNLM